MATSSRKQANAPQARRVALVVHRYVGLVIAVFLLVAGCTGSLLAFYEELDVALNPELFEVKPPTPFARPLDPFELSQRIEAQLPAGQHHRTVHFDQRATHAQSVWIETGGDEWRELFIHPYSGAALGSRDWGNLFEGKKNLMPFIYRLHYSLALGDVGSYLFGIVALLWTIDCFVGAYLTFPPARKASESPRRSWLARWRPAWIVRANKIFALVFTWHRASGLWVWAMLFVFAWSAVGLNLSSVYRPVMGAAFGLEERVRDTLPKLKAPYPEPELSLREAHANGRKLMATEAKRRGFKVVRELSLDYSEGQGAFVYRVESDLDISNKYPRTEVYFDGKTGRLLGFEAPSGMSTGNTMTSWLYALHFGAVGGVWYRVFVCIMGGAVAALSVSGVWIWWRKRQKRAENELRAPARDEANQELGMVERPSF